MACKYRISNTMVSSGNEDVDIQIPSNMPVGLVPFDIMFFHGFDADNEHFGAGLPEGWAVVQQENSNSNMGGGWYWKRYDGNHLDLRFFTPSASGNFIGGVIHVYKGCIKTGTPFVILNNQTVAQRTSHSAGSGTNDVTTLAVSLISIEDNVGVTKVDTSGSWNEDNNQSSATGSDGRLIASSSESTGTVEQTYTSGNEYSMSLLLKLIPDTDRPTIVLETADAHDFGDDDTPTLEFTGRSALGSDIDHYRTNSDTVGALISVGDIFGQSFDSVAVALKTASFSVARDGTITGGTFVAKLYAHTGTYGTTSDKTGSVLATSEVRNATDILTDYVSPSDIQEWLTFVFETPFTLSGSTNYVILIEVVTAITGGGTIRSFAVNTVSRHAGNRLNEGGSIAGNLKFIVLGNGEDLEYQVQIFSAIDIEVDSYGAFGDIDQNISHGIDVFHGQSFTGDGSKLQNCTFWEADSASPVGFLYAVLYAHTQTFGVDSEGDGVALAISYPVDISGISSTATAFKFEFDGEFTLVNGTKYVIGVHNASDEAIGLGRDSSSPTHDGNATTLGITWTNAGGTDAIFLVNSHIIALDKLSETPDATFTNTTDGGDSHPFDEGDKADFTVGNKLADFYTETEGVSIVNLGNGANLSRGQSFTGEGGDINKVAFNLSKFGSPTGTMTAKIYAHSGTFGSSSIPTGSILATSDTFTPSSLTTALVLTELNFSTPFTATDGTKYCIVLNYTSGDASNYVQIGWDGTSPTHDGNSFYHNGTIWVDESGQDFSFYIYEEQTLADGEWFWRARAIDPSGTNEWSDFTAIRSFDIADNPGAMSGTIDCSSTVTCSLVGKGEISATVWSATIEQDDNGGGTVFYNDGNRAFGENFQNFNSAFESCEFSLQKSGSPVFDVEGQIWSLSGENPDTLLQSSSNVIAASSVTSLAWFKFFFDASTVYNQRVAVVMKIVNHTSSSGTDLLTAFGNILKYHDGRRVTQNSSDVWSNQSNFDSAFKLKLSRVTVNVINQPSVEPISATIDGVSDVTAIILGTGKVSLTANCSSTVTCGMFAIGTMSATIDCNSDTISDIRGFGRISATINCSSTLTVDVIEISADPISGTIDGVSTVSAILQAKGILQASIDANSGVACNIMARGDVVGTINTSSNVTAKGIAIIHISGAVDTSSNVTANIIGKGLIQATINPNSVTTANLIGDAIISATVDANSIVTCSLIGFRFGSATIDGSSTVTVDVLGKTFGSGTIDGDSIVTCNILANGRVVGTIDANSNVTANISAKGLLQSTIDANSNVTAILLGKVFASATIDGNSIVTCSHQSKKASAPAFLKPDGDIATGSWTVTPLWSKIDDGQAEDDVIIQSEAVSNTVSTSFADGTWETATDPGLSTGHILRAKWASSSTRDITAFLELWQGVPGTGSLIATTTVAILDATEVQTNYTLTGTEADNITDYTDLHWRLYGVGLGGGPARALVVDWIELELPGSELTLIYGETINASSTVTCNIIGLAGTSDITGTINTSTDVTCILVAKGLIQATVDANSDVSCNLVAKGILQATVDANSDVTVNVIGIKIASATIDANSDVSCILVGKGILQGTINANSIVTVNAQDGGDNNPISGTIDANSNVTANLVGEGILQATIDANSVVTANLVNGTSPEISGTIDANSDVTANLIGKTSLSATIDTDSEITCNLIGKGIISATIDTSSNVTANAQDGGDNNPISGTVDGNSVVTVNIEGKGEILASIDASSDVTCSLVNVGVSNISATINTATNVTANLEGKGEVSATINTASDVTCSLIGKGTISATIDTASDVTVNVDAKSMLSATIDGNSVVTCNLIGLGASAISGIINASSSVTCNLTGKGTIQATIDCDSDVTANIEAKGLISATINTVSNVTANIVQIISISATINGVSIVTCNLTAKGIVKATIDCNSLVTCNLVDPLANIVPFRRNIKIKYIEPSVYYVKYLKPPIYRVKYIESDKVKIKLKI